MDNVAWIGDRIATGNMTSFTIPHPMALDSTSLLLSFIASLLMRAFTPRLLWRRYQAWRHVSCFNLETKTAVPITEGHSEDI